MQKSRRKPTEVCYTQAVRTVKDLRVEGEKILLRTDYDVPLTDGRVTDPSRIQASLPTINELLKRKADKITILCHLGRPGGRIVEALRVRPAAEYLASLLPKAAPVEVKENLRFHPGEETNSLDFAKDLAASSSLFVNDAFAASHRWHASIARLPELLPAAIGLQFEKEVRALEMVHSHPRRPLILIVGGAKLETKLPLVEKLAKLVDEILVGGKIAQEVEAACSNTTLARMDVARQTEDGKDITPQSAAVFARKIMQAGTVVWNGPLGVYEEETHSRGTRVVAQAISRAPGYTVIGGGDTEAAATKFAALEGIDHVSMGGGAMLQYLADGTLPGLQAIERGKKW